MNAPGAVPRARSAADRFLPAFDFVERHATPVAAPPEVVYGCVRELDLSGSAVVRLLFGLRGMPRSALRLDGMHRLGFRILADLPADAIVLGLIGRFWTTSGGICRFEAPEFAGFAEPGYAKAVWGFNLTPLDGGRTLLETETRVRCTDTSSRRSFRLYWLLVRPFSGLIRRIALREIKRRAETETAGTR